MVGLYTPLARRWFACLQEAPSLLHFWWLLHGRDAGYPAPPAQTRTCSIPASGSSVALASAQAETVTGPPPVCCSPRVGLVHVDPALPVRHEFPLRAACSRQVLPPVRGFPTLRVLFLIRLPIGIRRVFPFTVLLRLPAPQFPPST